MKIPKIPAPVKPPKLVKPPALPHQQRNPIQNLPGTNIGRRIARIEKSGQVNPPGHWMGH